LKIVCAGWNYRPHLKGLNGPLPSEPMFFFKPSTCLIHDGESIVIPEGVTNVQYEAEVAVVIGRTGKNIPESEALSYVSHIAAFNDVTARDMQYEARKKGDTWDIPKGMDTFGPVSEYVPYTGQDLDNLHITLTVNGEKRQDGNTRDMIFTIPKLISHVSRYVTLEKGDILSTGTPEGVGEIKKGDVVCVEIEGIVKLTNTVQ